MSKMKKEGNKPKFRSEAKRVAYAFLESQMRETNRRINENKMKMKAMQKDQSTLKKDLAALYQVMSEFKKS